MPWHGSKCDLRAFIPRNCFVSQPDRNRGRKLESLLCSFILPDESCVMFRFMTSKISLSVL
jgi:hypothetical protein